MRSISVPEDNAALECGKAIKPNLQIGNYVNVTDEEGLLLKSSPDKAGITKMVLPRGTRIKNSAGPVCNEEGYYYFYKWFVQTDTGVEGWITEGNSLQVVP